MTFWDDKCSILSNKLWIPSLLIDHNPAKIKDFKCQNKNITFNYFSDKDIIKPNLKFKPMPVPDNTDAKIKLESQLMKKEMSRLNKEFDNPNNKLSDKQTLEKHFQFYDKIDDKINRLDDFIRSHKIQILPNVFQKKIIQ